MKDILFICTGNTCRSPMAEKLAASLFGGYAFSSAGLCANDGAPMSANAALVLTEAGVTDTAHRAVQLTTERGNAADLIICMTPQHRDATVRRYPYIKTPCAVMPTEVGDPFGGSPEVYRRSLRAIRDGLNRLFIRLEPLCDKKLDAVTALEKQVFSLPWPRSAFERAVSDSAYHFITASDGRRLVGYACLLSALDEGTVMNIVVDPSKRGRGIGELLLSELLAIGERIGLTCYFLEARASNSAALSLYKKHGFAEISVRRNYYSKPSEDAVIMKRTDAR